jgi:hypothetical protein
VRRLALLAGVLAAGTALAATGPVIVELPRPQFPAATKASPRAGQLELAVVSSQRNAITDEAAWVRRNRLQLREYEVPGSLSDLPLRKLPHALPTCYDAGRGCYDLVRAARQQNGRILLVYGWDSTATGRYLFVVRPDGHVVHALDFARYAYAPVTAPGEREYVYQQLVWAAEAGGTLYVENAHSTYARSSGGRNAYISAIDLRTGKLRWRTGPLVANARTFELVGGTIVTGYGFTDEPDYLYLLDRSNGRVISRTLVPSAPEYVVRKGSRLFVRTYDHDLVVKLVRA